MAHSIKDKQGASSSPSISGTSGALYVIGPASLVRPGYRGRYIRESQSGADFTYRWLADEPIAGAAPATFSFTASN